MDELEFYLDEAGNVCARGKDERVATFLQTDMQGSVQGIKDLIAQLEDGEEHSEFHGNAHSLSISTLTVTIESNFDDEAVDRRLSRTEMIEILKAWQVFVDQEVQT